MSYKGCSQPLQAPFQILVICVSCKVDAGTEQALGQSSSKSRQGRDSRASANIVVWLMSCVGCKLMQAQRAHWVRAAVRGLSLQ